MVKLAGNEVLTEISNKQMKLLIEYVLQPPRCKQSDKRATEIAKELRQTDKDTN